MGCCCQEKEGGKVIAEYCLLSFAAFSIQYTAYTVQFSSVSCVRMDIPEAMALYVDFADKARKMCCQSTPERPQ
jgi:hypothetical protein